MCGMDVCFQAQKLRTEYSKKVEINVRAALDVLLAGKEPIDRLRKKVNIFLTALNLYALHYLSLMHFADAAQCPSVSAQGR